MPLDLQTRHETLAIATFKLREAEKRFMKYQTGAARDQMFEAQRLVDKLLKQEGEIIKKTINITVLRYESIDSM